jgi:thiol-disulfide isomerase/thioredoxin
MSAAKKTPAQAATGGSGAAKKRIAQQRAAQAAAKKAQERRRRVVVVVSVTVVVALVAAGALALSGLFGATGSASASGASGSLPSTVEKAVMNVPVSDLNAVGAGTASVAPAAMSAPALKADGKPEVLYIGAEFCPYCAAERWPMAVALSRFGRFTGLGETASSSTDVYPSTQTLSFEGAHYSSPTIDFVGKEIENAQGQPLDKLTSAQQKLFDTYDAPPYTSSAGKGGIPFVDIGGRYLVSEVAYDPQILQGKSRAQIAAALSDPTSTIGSSIDGAANAITAAICKVTANAPSGVCDAPGVVAAAKTLK